MSTTKSRSKLFTRCLNAARSGKKAVIRVGTFEDAHEYFHMLEDTGLDMEGTVDRHGCVAVDLPGGGSLAVAVGNAHL